MTLGQFMVIPLFIAFQAFMMMAIAPYIPGNYTAAGGGALGGGLWAWVSFQAWAMYFLAGFAPWNDQPNGPTPKMGAKTAAGYIGGIAASIAIFELNKVLGGLNHSSGAWGLYIAVFIVVVGVISCERVPGFNFIPSWFVGAGIFFGLMTYVPRIEGVGDYEWYARLTLAEMVACFVGLAFGYITVAFRVKYESKFTAQE